MKATLALYWKTLLKVIHPPLALTPRESQRVLFLLNKSFRKQIDAQYTLTPGHLVNTHIHSVLESPMFSDNIRSGGTKRKTTNTMNEQLGADPVGYLRRAMVGGYAIQETVRRCLAAQIRKSRLTTHFASSLRESQIGHIVVQWLWSTGMQRNLQFLPDRTLTALMIQILVAYGRRDLILAWIKPTEQDLQQVSVAQISPSDWSRIFLELMKAETTAGRGLGTALNVFSQYTNECQQARLKQKRRQAVFGPSAHYLMRQVCANVQAGVMDIGRYDQLGGSITKLFKDNTLEAASMAAYRPEQASPAPTLAYMKALSHSELAKMPYHRRAATTDIAIRAAELFLSQGKHAEALWLMTALQNEFSDILGLDDDMRPSYVNVAKVEPEEERANVLMLERLALG